MIKAISKHSLLSIMKWNSVQVELTEKNVIKISDAFNWLKDVIQQTTVLGEIGQSSAEYIAVMDEVLHNVNKAVAGRKYKPISREDSINTQNWN
jgi:hypothetical protein